jgi:polar amino acid transport system substrate-binding protein
MNRSRSSCAYKPVGERVATLAGRGKVLFLIAILVSAWPLASRVWAGETLDRVRAKGVLVVATDPAWPPYSWKDENGNWQGFDASVAIEIGKRLNASVEFVTPPWETIVAGKWQGKWDLSVGSMSPTEERAKNLDFPSVYYYSPAVLAVHKDNKSIVSPADANGKRIGALKGSIMELYLKREPLGMADEVLSIYKIDNPDIKSYDTSEAASDDLAKGDGVVLDALVDDMMYILYLIKNGKPLKIVGQPVSYGPNALAIEVGDSEFSDLLKKTIADMREGGTLSALSTKWFELDLTKQF